MKQNEKADRGAFRTKTSRSMITLILAVVFVLLGAVSLFCFVTLDRVDPEITFSSASLTLTEEETEDVLNDEYDCLLTGVQAQDNHDGDLTDRVLVESVKVDEETATADVIYIVSDAEGNFTRETRTVTLQGVEAGTLSTTYPYIRLTAETVEVSIGETVDTDDYITGLADDTDSLEDLYENVTVDGEVDVYTEGSYELTYTVQDSDGNTSEPVQLIVTVTR